MSAANELTSAQRDDLRTVAAMIVPASDEYKVPGADDPAIQADMLATLGRDTAQVSAGARSSRASRRQAAGRTRFGAARCGRKGVPRHRRRCCGDARSRRPAMLLPRRPRAALARAGASRAVPERLHAGAGRLVAARSCQGPAFDAAACALGALARAVPGHHLREPKDIRHAGFYLRYCRRRPVAGARSPPLQTTRLCSTPIPTPSSA